MEKMKKIEYTNGEVTVVWKPELCAHAGNCVKSLPDVYKPKNRPWVNIDAATTEGIKAQMKTCPSGALTYYINAEKIKDNSALKRYELDIAGEVAFIEYILVKDKIYLTHTEVPKSLSGKGIGSQIVYQALNDVEERKLTLIPLCPYVALYIQRNPRYKSLVLKNINISD